MGTFMKFTIKLVVLSLFFSPMVALAELPEQVQADFSVVAGVVVMPINDEYIVDLDARDNLQVGDVLTQVKPGKKIFHPVTKEVIGTVDDVVGFLQVTRVYSGYSYAKALTAGLAPQNGASFKRFEKVPAILVIDDQADKELARQIQVDLPHLLWLQDSQSDQALLTFNLQENALDVKTAQGNSLHRYLVTKDQQLVSTATSAPRPYAAPQSGPEPGPLQKVVTSLMGNVYQSNDERFAEIDEAIIRQNQSDRKGIWMGPNINGHPTGLAVADLDGDGRLEIAVALDKTILIGRVTDGKFDQLVEVDTPPLLQLLSIDALDLDNDGRSELYLSALAAERPSSFVVAYDGSNYGIVIDSVRWLLRAVTLPGETGRTLIGQRINNTVKAFADEIFRVERDGGELVKGNPTNLPDKLNLFNFMAFTDDKNKLNYLYLSDGDYLKVISADGAQLWESEDYFGGSENCFNLQDIPRVDMQYPNCMQPRLVMMPGNEIVVVQNESQRIIQRYRSFKKSRLVALAWNGFAMMESWKTASQLGYLGDFAVADADNDGKDELVMAIKFQHKGLTNEARSSVVIYELE
jgi:hypothetical protein